jgi:hypothetical protein
MRFNGWRRRQHDRSGVVYLKISSAVQIRAARGHPQVVYYPYYLRVDIIINPSNKLLLLLFPTLFCYVATIKLARDS